MNRVGRSIAFCALSFALAGCCSYGPYNRYGPTSYAGGVRHTVSWDGRFLAGPKAYRPSRSGENISGSVIEADDAELAKRKRYSPEWWAVYDELDRKNDARLAKALTICRGCLATNFASSQAEPTGSIAKSR